MKVLNLLAEGGTGGIETLCNSIDVSNIIDNYWCFLIKGGEIANQIKERNPNKTIIFNHNKFLIVKTINKITDICQKEKIDIVVVHHGGTYCNMIFYYLRKRNPNIKFVRFLHSCYEEEYTLKNKYIQDKICLYYFNRALQRSDLIVSVSKAVQESHEKIFDLSSNKKVVIYNGIGNEFYTQKVTREEGSESGELKIIYVGRLVKSKGIDILINAIAHLKKDRYNVRLTIVGDGEEKENLQKLVNILEIDAEVDFVGKKKNVIEYLDKSDVFVYPSRWKEAFGISVVEAMSRGCIPITFNKGGLPEIIKNNKNGFIIDEINGEMLARKIEEIINMKSKKEIIENAIETSKEFTIINTINNLRNVYEGLIDDKK